MKKVLLVIDGITPDKKVFRYAIQLCKRIKAELNVFQIINPRNYGEYLKKVRKGAGHARGYIESSMVAATFAEAGEHETAKEIMSVALRNINLLLPESEKEGVQCHFTIKPGAPDKEIINYVNTHRDVVLTIYDSSRKDHDETSFTSKKRAVSRQIKQKLSVPLLVVHS